MTTVQEIIQDKEEYDDTLKQFKRPQRHSSHVKLLSDIIDAEPYSYEEVAKKKVKENTSSRRMMSRMRYRRPQANYVMSSIWIYKIHHAVYGNIVGYKARLVA